MQGVQFLAHACSFHLTPAGFDVIGAVGADGGYFG